MAENPATWGKAERVVHEVLQRVDNQRMSFVCGFSVEKQITDALRAAGLLKEETVLEVILGDGCVGGHHPDQVSCELGADWP